MDNYEQQIYAIKEAQANKLVNDLNAKKEESLTSLGQQEQTVNKQAVASKQTANISSQIGKLNFAEFMAKRGQTNAGIAQAAEMSRQNVLARDIGNIEANKAVSLNTIEQGRQSVNRDYNTNLTGGMASIESDIATKLLNYREQLRQEQLAREEQLRREELARQNSELDYQRSLATRSSGGGSSGNSYPVIEDTLPVVSTEYYQGDYNPDVSKGTFSNGYQPNNIGGKKLTDTKSTIKFNTQTLNGKTKAVTQTIWKTPDGKKWVWDGRYNEYLPASLYK